MDFDIQKTAELASLKISKEEQDLFAQQFSRILGYMEKIATIETQGVEPLVTPIQIKQNLREDQTEKWSGTEDVLSRAPEKSNRLFKTPQVL